MNQSLTTLPLDSGATRIKHPRFSPVVPDNWDTDPDAPDPGSEMSDFEHIPLAERLRER